MSFSRHGIVPFAIHAIAFLLMAAVAMGDVKYEDVKRHFVIITTDRAAGSGFIVKIGGKLYVLTNQHVISGTGKFTIRTIDGQLVRPLKIEIAMNADLARFQLEGVTNGLDLADDVNIDEPVVIYGNAGGAGVVTKVQGYVRGVGPSAVEVSAKFESGNSGSPVLNREGRVLGVATYLTIRPTDTGKLMEDRRNVMEVRRFALRISDTVQWRAVRWQDFVAQTTRLADSEEFCQQVQALMTTWVKSPYGRLIDAGHMPKALAQWINNHNDNVAGPIEKFMQKGQVDEFQLKSANRQFKKAIGASVDDLTRSIDVQIRSFRPAGTEAPKLLTPHLDKQVEEQVQKLQALKEAVKSVGGAISQTPAVTFR